jgi:hypothetical protein
MRKQFMKITFALFSLSLLVLAGCASSPTPPATPTTPAAKPETKPAKPAPQKDMPETVLVTYHVKAGMEDVFEHLLSQAWATYRKEHLVLTEPHVIVRQPDANNTSTYVEVFTWVSHAAPAKASADVQQIWGQEHSLCEARGGQQPLGGGEVELVVPAHK